MVIISLDARTPPIIHMVANPILLITFIIGIKEKCKFVI